MTRPLAASICALLLCACDSGDQPKPTADTASAPGSASATTTASAVTVAEPLAYPPKKIAAGAGPDGLWSRGFDILREQGNAGLHFAKAYDHCINAGKALCSETQWQRACEADDGLGKLETWTATYAGKGKFVVRGGKGCSTRQTVAGGEKSPTRVAVCCTRAVGIDSGNKNLAFRKASAKKVLDYEEALRPNARGRIADLYADQVSFLGRRFDKSALMREYDRDMKRFPEQWTFFDTCKVELGKDAEGETTLVSDCRTVLRRGKNAYGASIRFVHGGPDNKIVQVGFKAAKGETAPASDGEPGSGEEKEGFGFLIPAED